MRESKKMTNQAMNFTKEVTTRWPSRLAGSDACQSCGHYLLEEINVFCDRAYRQSFEVHPGSFLGFMKISVIFYFLSLIALWTNFLLIGTALALIPIFITITHFFYYKEVIDFLYPKKTGHNIIGTIEPTSEVKQHIIISAHHDSAHVFNFLEDDPLQFSKKVMRANLSVFGLAFASLILLILSFFFNLHPFIGYAVKGAFTILGISVLQMLFFYDKKGTPGAGDNMICTSIAIEVVKYFSQLKNESRLKHTRLSIISFDAEEAGLRGARAFVKKHKEELYKVKTYNFNLECMYDHEELGLLQSDLNSFVPLSQKMVDECANIASEQNITIKKVSFPLMAGGTDAAEFAKAGIEATTLAAMSWSNRGEDVAYHTTRDTIEAVDPIAVENSIRLALAYIRKMDEVTNPQ